MTDAQTLLLKSNLKHLRLPTMHAEFEALAREASEANENYQQYLLRLTELEVAGRAANVLKARIKQAGFPALKDFDSYDFTAQPSLNKPKVLELANADWIKDHFNICFVGNSGTGKTHLATALALAACRQGWRVRFFTAAGLVNHLEEAQKQYQLQRFLQQLDRADLLLCDELGYLSFNRAGAELLFQLFADRYERKSLLVTSNLPFGGLGAGLSGRTHDGGVAGPLNAPLSHFRDEWRKLPLPRVDEGEEGDQSQEVKRPGRGNPRSYF